MSDALVAATATLVRRFRRQRPLRAGSLLVTIFGDAIAPRGGAVTLGSLIALAAPFGLTERLVRTSVARLAQEGWLTSRREGRRSEYRLSPEGRRRFGEATRRIYGASPADWGGRWTLLVLPPQMRADRERLREELKWLGFGQVSPGVLAHPVISCGEARERLQAFDGAAAEVMVLEARTGEPQADRRVADAGWDLADLAQRYGRFVREFTPVQAALAAAAVPAPQQAFVIRTLLIHRYRRIHLRDPLLPASLLPRQWVGIAAYELCRALYAQVFAPAEQHLTAAAETMGGALPPPAAEAFTRFGGVPAPAASVRP